MIFPMNLILSELGKYPNLIILQTFSKAFGCAAIRLGMAFASEGIIGVLNKIKYPYNVNQLTQQQAIEMLHKYYEIERWVKTLKEERGIWKKLSLSCLAYYRYFHRMPTSFWHV